MAIKYKKIKIINHNYKPNKIMKFRLKKKIIIFKINKNKNKIIKIIKIINKTIINRNNEIKKNKKLKNKFNFSLLIYYIYI